MTPSICAAYFRAQDTGTSEGTLWQQGASYAIWFHTQCDVKVERFHVIVVDTALFCHKAGKGLGRCSLSLSLCGVCACVCVCVCVCVRA